MWFDRLEIVPDQGVQRNLNARQSAQVSKRLKALRLGNGYTMRKLADLAGISSGTVSKLESGRAQPTLATMLALQAVFELGSIEELLAPVSAAPAMPSIELAALADHP